MSERFKCKECYYEGSAPCPDHGSCASKMKFTINITTHDQCITQIVESRHDDWMLTHMVDVLSRTMMDLREEGIKEALIELGWTPPKETV
jgi:hypothetical protein